MSDLDGWQVAIEFGPDGFRSVAMRGDERRVLEEFDSMDAAFGRLTELLPTEEPPLHKCGEHCWQVGGEVECIHLDGADAEAG